MNEKTKTYLGWAIIIAVLIVAGGVWSMAKTYSKSQEPGTYRSFAVSGEGKAVGVPDVAEFTFSVINEGTKDITTLEAANTAKVNKSRVQGHEAGTKTVRSNREIHLHENLVEVLKARKPLHVRPDDYAFTTP